MPNQFFIKANPGTHAHLVELHEQMKVGEINIPDLRRKYLNDFPADGTMMLLQDIQRFYFIYNNLYEEVKKLQSNLFVPTLNQDQAVHKIREKYQQTGLVPDGYLPQNTLFSDLLGSAVDSMRKLFRGTINLTGTYFEELGKAFLLETGTTVVFQIEAGIGGKAIVGWERTLQ